MWIKYRSQKFEIYLFGSKPSANLLLSQFYHHQGTAGGKTRLSQLLVSFLFERVCLEKFTNDARKNLMKISYYA
jgi:hypothetical protein